MRQRRRLAAAMVFGLALVIPSADSLHAPAAGSAAGPSESSQAASQTAPAPAEPDAYARALALYRDGRFPEAGAILDEAIRSDRGGRGYRTLLGWCFIRQRRFAEAEGAFRGAVKEEPGSREARTGLASALAGKGDAEPALEIALALVMEDRSDPEALAIANRVLASPGGRDRRLGAAPPAGGPAVLARASRDYLEVDWSGRFVPIFVKGVNLGVALPGRFPAEFPMEVGTYREWLDQIGAMGANAVRLYTLLPPVFYQALAEHNRDVLAAAGPGAGEGPPEGWLWLIQGVWTELPENDRYDDPAFSGQFLSEIERVLDAVHGNIAVARRPGHAFGLYLSDVSRMTLALILGREWEPYSVEAYDSLHPDASFEGRYFHAEGSAMESWLASTMDHAVDHETRRYGVMRPVAFTNWPTLDPLHHPTEATKAEESEIARRLGIPSEGRVVREYDNDGSSVDANRIRPTREALAGQFASYHAYPYYPDFMNLDPVYLQARDRYGPNNYVGYLTALRRHHSGMPLLIAEVGVPTSRGVAHVQPQGFHHGGHNETGQGEIDARLMENIFETGCAGGIVFAWLDEWFKRNWLVMEFEVPAERNPKWLNALDPEQNYGLLAARPGKEGPAVVLDGRGEDWSGRQPLVAAADAGRPPSSWSAPAGVALRALWAAHDEAYLYLRLDVAGQDGRREPDWGTVQYLIGIDTYGTEEGDKRFPGAPDLVAPAGMEFIVSLSGRDSSRLLVDAPYDIHTHRYNRPYRSVPNDDGRYIEILAETNRRRIGRDGTIFPEAIRNRSPLRHGTTAPEAPDYDDLADWIADASTGIIEVRLPWGLLNVTDPSSLRVLDDDPALTEGVVGTRRTEGFRIYAAALDPRDGTVLDSLPARAPDGKIPGNPSMLYTWSGWEEPAYHTRLKRSYFILRDRLAALPDVVAR